MRDMRYGSHGLLRRRLIPIIGWSASKALLWRNKQQKSCLLQVTPDRSHANLPPYPFDPSTMLNREWGTLDGEEVPRCTSKEDLLPHHPTRIALSALDHWNAYLETGAYQHKVGFINQANWFVRHECRLSEDMSGWPLSCLRLNHHRTPQLWLSALTQGQIISVLVRAYRLTGDYEYLNVARRAVTTFKRDILDDGVSTPVGDNGVFLEEVAVYPASHILNGFMLALF